MLSLDTALDVPQKYAAKCLPQCEIIRHEPRTLQLGDYVVRYNGRSWPYEWEAYRLAYPDLPADEQCFSSWKYSGTQSRQTAHEAVAYAIGRAAEAAFLDLMEGE